MALKITKNPKEEPKENEDMDEIEENFLRILKRGIGKYKGKLLLKCFNCRGICHYAYRCMYKEYYGGRLNDDNKGKKNYRGNNIGMRRDNRDKKKKNYCSMKAY